MHGRAITASPIHSRRVALGADAAAILIDRLLLLAGDLRVLRPLSQLRRKLRAEVLRFEHLANLDLGIPWHRIGAAFDPFDRVFLGVHLPQPETGDEVISPVGSLFVTPARLPPVSILRGVAPLPLRERAFGKSTRPVDW